jgi:hypothetical protein
VSPADVAQRSDPASRSHASCCYLLRAGEERFGYKVLTVSSAAVPNGIAAICLAMRDKFGLIPHVYFDWTEGSPLMQFLRFILWGAGEVAPVTREILRRAEPDRSRRPHVHVG